MQKIKPLQKQEYTYEDYMTWPENEHWELIDGEAYPTYGMTALAAPALAHQDLVLELGSSLKSYLRGKQCRVFASPVDVVFEEAENTKTVVQPDLVVVCDPKKIENGKRIIGAPDIAIEVLSPSTAPKDWMKKSRLYESQGVKEYWIISPDGRTVYQNILKDGQYEMKALAEGELTSEVLEGFALNLGELFAVLDENPPITESALHAAEQRGRQESAMEIAKSALQKGLAADAVAEITGLDRESVEALRPE